MSKVDVQFIEQRAFVLAMVQFTSRSDLSVVETPRVIGFDMLVRIATEKDEDQVLFGVKLLGTNQTLSGPEEAAKHLMRRPIGKHGKPLPRYTFPVIVLLFSMRDDRGYFAWRLEPGFDERDGPKLKSRDEMVCSVFDRASLGEIVDKVSGWHERLFVMLGEV